MISCKNVFIGLLILSLQYNYCFSQKDVKNAIAFANAQTHLMLNQPEVPKLTEAPLKLVSPRTLNKSGGLEVVSIKDWCSGFFAGELWLLYELNGNDEWMKNAKYFTSLLEQAKNDKGTHDLGFMIYSSYGKAYSNTHDDFYQNVIIQAANSLSTRFNSKIGCIKSWESNKQWKFPVIIDNMMNLELLFAATKLSGDSSYYKIAITHANTTLKNHYRPDHSSYHVVDYDSETGAVIKKVTAQGYANESAWARGQAWGLYGYTMCYRETHDPVYLKQAEDIANFIFTNPSLPADLVPYWDYDVPDKQHQPRDASAASIAASALYELSTYSAKGRSFRKIADRIITSLEKNYQSKQGENKGFLLLHSTGHKPANSEIDVPIIYADYYYLEALLRKKRLYDGVPLIDILK